MSTVSTKITHEVRLALLRPYSQMRVRKCAQYAKMIWVMPYNHSELGHYRILERWNWI